MRVLANSDDIKLAEFDNWAVTLGDDALPVVGDPSEDNIQLPQDMCIEVDEANNERDLKTFCDKIYPNFEQRYKEEGYMEGRAILAPTNKIRDNINAYMMSRLPTEEVVLLSADSTVQPGDSDRYPTEMLNSLQPQGIPAHKLVLRPGAPLRLMRNLNPKDGLCNGTRMLFVGVINNKVCSLLQCIESLTENDIIDPPLHHPRQEVPWRPSRRLHPKDHPLPQEHRAVRL